MSSEPELLEAEVLAYLRDARAGDVSQRMSVLAFRSDLSRWRLVAVAAVLDDGHVRVAVDGHLPAPLARVAGAIALTRGTIARVAGFGEPVPGHDGAALLAVVRRDELLQRAEELAGL